MYAKKSYLPKYNLIYTKVIIYMYLVQKRRTKWIFLKSHIFWKMCPDSKQDVKNHEIYTEANIEYFAFLNCCNLSFWQTEIITLWKSCKKDMNFSEMALCERFSYCKFEILRLPSCIAFQVANRTEISFLIKKTI